MDVYSDVKKCYQASYYREDNWNVFEKKEVNIDVKTCEPWLHIEEKLRKN